MKQRSTSRYRGSGLLGSLAGAVGTVVNKAIDYLPAEIHIPGYQFCGPGTKLAKRLARGDPGINKLDAACKQHDIAYATNKDNSSRAAADRVLAERAWERVKAGDSSLSEKAAAWAVTNIMKAKSALGSGVRLKRVKRKSQMKRVKKESKTIRKNKNTRNTKKSKKVANKKNGKKGKGLYLKPYQGSGIKKKKTSSTRLK